MHTTEFAVIYECRGVEISPTDCERARLCYQLYGQAHIWASYDEKLIIAPEPPPLYYKVEGALTDWEDSVDLAWYVPSLARLGYDICFRTEQFFLKFHRHLLKAIRFCSYRMG